MMPILPYDTEQRIRAALAAAGEMQTPDRVEKALLRELRGRNRRMLAARIAVASGLAAAVLAGLFLMRPPAPAVPVAKREVPVPTVAPVPPMVAKAVLKRPVRRRAPVPVRQQQAAAAQNDFIPVGPWQAMEPMERGSIIRVRMPKSSLPGFGIPVSADRWHESVPADVVLGEDGSMRAVRFVNTSQF